MTDDQMNQLMEVQDKADQLELRCKQLDASFSTLTQSLDHFSKALGNLLKWATIINQDMGDHTLMLKALAELNYELTKIVAGDKGINTAPDQWAKPSALPEVNSSIPTQLTEAQIKVLSDAFDKLKKK